MAKQPPQSPAPRRVYRILGPKAGRRRAGFAFGADPVVLTDLDITEDQVAQLVADPELVVDQVAAAPEPVAVAQATDAPDPAALPTT